MPTTHVAGRILVAGRPIAGGWLEFQPVGGTVGKLRSAEIGPDGTFRAGRVPLGRVGIRLIEPKVAPTGNQILDKFVFATTRSYDGILRDTRRAPEAMVIDLKDELSRVQARMAPQ
jgi:hypothetical protein